MRTLFICCIACVAMLPLQAQVKSDFATTLNRTSETKRLKALVDSVVQLPIDNKHAAAWKSACWAMELMLYAHPRFEERLQEITVALQQIDAPLQWALLEAWYTLYPGKSAHLLIKGWPQARSNKIKALMLQHFDAGKIQFAIPDTDSFRYSRYYRMYTLDRQKVESQHTLKSIEQMDLLPGQSLLVSVQYRDRDKPGFLIIRDHQGKWLKDQQGKLVRYTQLARSITNLPYYLTNGNTPQGLYKIIGTDISNNVWIGPTRNLQLVMPFETGVDTPFFSDTTQSAAQYAALLGRLSGDTALWQSYFAGLLGRSEIIAHGTTIPSVYYAGKTYYPNTPSLGCLCSPELWGSSGNRLRSVQEEWMTKLTGMKVMPNYLLVIEVAD